MKKRHQAGKKIAAWLMALSLCMTAVPAEQVVYAAGGQNETEVTELTENPETAENTEALDDSETAESEDTEDNGEENTSEAVETDSTENESETTENTESVKDTEATESTEVTEISETTEGTQEVENSEMTETENTESVIGDTKSEDTETEESEEVVRKDGNVTPGSTYATAASIGLNTTYKATTSRKSVTHWYKFTMSKAGMVQLKFAHANLSSTSNSPAWKIDFIADQFGGMVSVNSGLQDTQNQTAKIGLEAGTYYVQVTGRGVLTIGSSDYSFSVQYEDIYCETEQNDSISTADNYTKLGQTITGSISSTSDTDYYKITSAAKGYLSFQLQHDKVSSKLATDIYSVAVCDASGNTIYTMTSRTDEEKTESVNFGLAAGTYYLKVSGVTYLNASGSFAIYGTNGETYKLNASWTNADNWESESNDTYDIANTAVSGITYSGDIRTYSDVDYFKTTLSANGYINVKLTHPVVSGQETTNMFVFSVIRKVDKDQYTEVYTTNIRGGDTSVSTPNLGLPKGEYYVKIAGTGNSAGTLLSGTSYPVNYDVCIKAKTAGDREVESNDSAATANSVKNGKTYYGSISSSSDKDYYKIKMSKPGICS